MCIFSRVAENSCVQVTAPHSGLFWSDPRVQAVAVLPPPPPLFCVLLLIDNWMCHMYRNSRVRKTFRRRDAAFQGCVTLSEEGYLIKYD